HRPPLTIQSKLLNRPLDLHVLGTPPAFVLSQDQTLHRKLSLASVRFSLRSVFKEHLVAFEATF
ncbi:hypothetical protein JS44_16085, partial [Anoxybacillus flavithermus]